jgi:hypothetical protein
MESDAMGEEPDQADLPDTGQSQSPLLPAAADYAALDRLVRVVLDARMVRKNLRELRDATATSNASREALAADRAAFDQYTDQAKAALAKREHAVVSRETAAQIAEEGVRERELGLIEQAAELRRQDMILRRRILLVARLDAPGPLQDFPSWKQISAELLNAEQLDLVDEAEAVTERPAGLPAAVTLTRTTYRTGRRSARRVEAS